VGAPFFLFVLRVRETSRAVQRSIRLTEEVESARQHLG
jgi:hypothetical protein